MSAGVGPAIGLFGLLGAGNLGNDGSLEAVLAWARERYPGAGIDVLCSGPEEVTARYGLPASRLHWNRREYRTVEGARDAAVKLGGKLVDAVRTLRWVRRHDLVVIPGMGVLEATLPLRPWGFPYSMLLLTAAGRLTRTPVALVSVGANTDGSRSVRRVFTLAARLAAYRSYRDELSREAMRASGVDVDRDAVYPDLVFALPDPVDAPAQPGTVAVGVMDYSGTEAERDRAELVRAAYVAKLQRFTRGLLDRGRRIRLVTGDRADEAVAEALLADLRAYRPDLDPSGVVHEPVTSLAGLMGQLAGVEAVVATRYHNVLCAVKLSKPTISLGYSAKNDVLMAQMGLAEFCQRVADFEVDLLDGQLDELLDRADQLTGELDRRNTTTLAAARRQLDVLSTTLLPRFASTVPVGA